MHVSVSVSVCSTRSLRLLGFHFTTAAIDWFDWVLLPKMGWGEGYVRFVFSIFFSLGQLRLLELVAGCLPVAARSVWARLSRPLSASDRARPGYSGRQLCLSRRSRYEWGDDARVSKDELCFDKGDRFRTS